MLQYWKRWVLAFLLVIAFAGAVAMGWIAPKGQEKSSTPSQGAPATAAELPAGCLDTYILPPPNRVMAIIAQSANIAPAEVIDYGYITLKGVDFFYWQTDRTQPPYVVELICWEGDPAEPVPRFGRAGQLQSPASS